MAQRLTIIRGPGGKLHVDASGFQGEACLRELEKFIQYAKAHGVELQVTQQERKEGEMYAAPDRSRADYH